MGWRGSDGYSGNVEAINRAYYFFEDIGYPVRGIGLSD